MIPSEMKQTPHRRLNILSGEWILVSPHRTQRPWQGQVERNSKSAAAPYDPQCYLCPGNQRANGERNPQYRTTFVFTNDFSALKPDGPAFHHNDSGLLLAEAESGTCRVLCFSPRHDLTLARMERTAIRTVIDLWSAQYADLGAQPEIRYVQIFENRGEMMGCSNPHPHGQVWASATVPNEPHKETIAQGRYLRERCSCMLCDYVALEQKSRERVVCENDFFLALVPFWAVWPYEILFVSKFHVRDIAQLEALHRDALADILRRVTTRYDNLFETAFPYSMGFHQSPTDGEPHPEWHLHGHFYPPLLRSSTIRKFMVGYEMLASPQRDITPELAASQLRALSEKHYLDQM